MTIRIAFPTALLLLGALLAPAARAASTVPPPRVRIGVYDSRAVAIAYFGSAAFGQRLARLAAAADSARAAGDTARAGRLARQGPALQVHAHERAFSTAGARDLLAGFGDQLPAIARDAGVVAIVSRWELPYAAPALEQVDVTLPLVRLFVPDAQARRILGQIEHVPPVPFDQVGLDPND